VSQDEKFSISVRVVENSSKRLETGVVANSAKFKIHFAPISTRKIA
jgi:hypothetical protein